MKELTLEELKVMVAKTKMTPELRELLFNLIKRCQKTQVDFNSNFEKIKEDLTTLVSMIEQQGNP